MTSLASSIEAVIRVMHALPIEFKVSNEYPVDDLMHAISTMRLVESERLALEATEAAKVIRDDKE